MNNEVNEKDGMAVDMESQNDGNYFDDLIEYCPEPDLGKNINKIPEPKSISAFQCPNCDFISNLYENVVKHFKTAHDSDSDGACETNSIYEDEEILVCGICYSFHKEIDLLKSHMINDHNLKQMESVTSKNENENKERSSEELNKCEKSIQQIIDIKEDKKIELPVMPFKQLQILLKRNMIYKCSMKGCFYKFDTKEKQKTHVRCHISTELEKIKEFKCFDCGHEVFEWRNCSSHMWNEHEIDVSLLSCPICTYKALSSVRIWRHMKIHKKWKTKITKSLKKYERSIPVKVKLVRQKYYSEKICQICNRKFKNGKTLSKHIKSVHNKIKGFICNICGKELSRKAGLQIHMRQHSNEKPLSCEYCLYKTRDPSALVKHKFRHIEKKKMPYKCQICKYKTIQSCALKKHIKYYHPLEFKKISCDQCKYSSVNRKKLKQHKDDHARGLIEDNSASVNSNFSKNINKPRIVDNKEHNSEISSDCFQLESRDSMTAQDNGGVTIPATPLAPSEETQYNNF